MSRLRLSVAACLFLITAAVAIRQDWTAGDLIWASWISSVVVGLGLVSLSLASFSLLKNTSLRTGCVIMLLGLFLPLWGAFQVGLAAILHGSFPLAREKFDLLVVLRVTLASYWTFVLTSALAEFNSLRSWWSLAGRMSKGGSYPVLIYGPFLNAGRMFLIVFLLACLNWAGLKGYALYPVLIFYFFPWDAVPWKALFGRKQGKQPSRDPDQIVLRYGGGMLSVVGVPLLVGGLFVISLPLWSESLQREWRQVRVFVVLFGLVLALAGVLLVFGRYRRIIDRRTRTIADWFRLGIVRWRMSHECLPARVSVRVARYQKSSSHISDGSGKLELTGRDGVVPYGYAVSIFGGGKEFPVDTFSAEANARELRDQVAAFLHASREEGPSDTAGPSEAKDSIIIQESDDYWTPCRIDETERTVTLRFHVAHALRGQLTTTAAALAMFGVFSAFAGSWLPLLTVGGFFFALLVIGGAINNLHQVRAGPYLIYDKPSDTLFLPRAKREIRPARKRVALCIRQRKRRVGNDPFELVALLDGKDEIPIVRFESRDSIRKIASHFAKLGIEDQTHRAPGPCSAGHTRNG